MRPAYFLAFYDNASFFNYLYFLKWCQLAGSRLWVVWLIVISRPIRHQWHFTTIAESCCLGAILAASLAAIQPASILRSCGPESRHISLIFSNLCYDFAPFFASGV